MDFSKPYEPSPTALAKPVEPAPDNRGAGKKSGPAIPVLFKRKAA